MKVDSAGCILDVDERGCVVKQATVSRIPAKWRPPVQRITERYVSVFGHGLRAVYVRGSVPLGEPRDYLSDVDTFALVDGFMEGPGVEWEDGLSEEVAREWPFVKSVEALVFATESIGNDRSVAVTISTQSACLYGTDFTTALPGYKPGIDLVLDGWSLPRDLATAKRVIAATNHPHVAYEACVWGMKRLIRSGFELVMQRAGCYTRDLHPCFRLFTAYYPDQRDEMASALELAVNPSVNVERIAGLSDHFGDWVYKFTVQRIWRGAHRAAVGGARRRRRVEPARLLNIRLPGQNGVTS